nr:hypothetical protein [Tanacetum cinerariifolium]
MRDGKWSRPVGFQLARKNLQSRVKEEDSITDVKNTVFDFCVMEPLSFLLVDERVSISFIMKFIKFIELNFSADGAQSSRVPVPLLKDPYEAIRQPYLVGADTESEPFEGESETPESPHTVALPTCHVEESEGFGTFGARSTLSDSTAPLSPDHPLSHTTPVLVPSLHRTVRMAMRVPPAMSPGLSVSIAEVADMSELAFRKRFRSSYDSSPSSTLLVRKRYRGHGLADIVYGPKMLLLTLPQDCTNSIVASIVHELKGQIPVRDNQD